MGRYAVITFGCQMNRHDSERLEEVLRGAGEEAARSVADADLVVVNTCSVREKAEQKLRSEVGRLARLKRARPDLVLVVAGCMAQQEGERMLGRMPAVDLVVGPDNIGELPELLGHARLGGPPLARTEFDTEAPRFLTAPSVGAGRPSAYVTTMKGCDERCSFCVVPNTRGPERYRPSTDVVGEIAALVEGGAREVTLLGQTVNSYRDPLGRLERAPGADPADPDESEFAALCRSIASEVPGLARLRYTSPHPRHLTPSLALAHRDLAVLPHHAHLPVQSGSDRVLKRMIRRHGRAEYLERLARLRALVPDLTVSTDVIVGFSGETEEDFRQTLSLVSEVGFVGVFGFKYSPRPHTPALRLGDDVPEPVKRERLARLFELSERLQTAHLAALVGSRQAVLLEGPSKSNPAHASGRSARNEIVHVAGVDPHALLGEIVEVRVEAAYRHSLLARLTEAETRRIARHRGPAPPPPRARRSLPVVASGA
jgi:tRNA-2-methylthio-N6-dimethylallyladenosine synthase